MFPSIHLAVTTTWTSSQTPDMAVGTRVNEGSNEYMMVKNGAAAVSVVGKPAYPMTAALAGHGIVGKNADRLNATSPALGAHVSAIPAGGYGFILTKGYFESLYGDAAIAAGEAIYANADIFDTAIHGTHHICGFAADADTASVFPGSLFCS